ncbi:E3 ubiquitin-protein ligase rnf8 [Aplochiton taeniatus]
MKKTNSSVAKRDKPANTDTWCLTRVGKLSGWLRLFENTEVTVGRGLDVTYQLLSPSCPLMISRLHCVFKQNDDGEWTVTDKESLNGVWVNGNRISAGKPHCLSLGDSLKLGTPIIGTKAEFEYILVREPIKYVKPYLANEGSREVPTHEITKRKYNADDLEPSTSSRTKLYRCSSSDKCFAQPCPTEEHQGAKTTYNVGPSDLPQDYSNCSGSQQDSRKYSQNILQQRKKVGSTQRQVAAPEATQQQGHIHRKEPKRKKVQEELTLSRQGFEEVLLAKDRELELTKGEKEMARAEKEEVVTQMTEVLENELQCIICSELFIQAVTLNCAHSFCLHCIGEWRRRKDECPICRQDITSQTRSLVLDNCIDRMVDNLSPDMKARRQALITERKGERCVTLHLCS